MRLSELCPLWRLLLPGLVLISSAFSFGAPVISEFMAANGTGLADEDGDFSDWIEIHNPDDTPWPLAGYHLTDDANKPAKWTFPAVTLDAGAYLVVFASGKNRTEPAVRLHTNFELAADGEYLALVAPDGTTILSAYAPAYPPQFENVSFGSGSEPHVWSYYAVPTPGAGNGNGTPSGPVVAALIPNPPPPQATPLTVAVRVHPVNGPVATVTLYYRQMFGAETMVPMREESSGNTVAGDHVWTATIPAYAFAPGQMTRWRFVATDARGAITKEPAFHDPLNSQQYFGTVGFDARIRTALPVLHWFTTNPTGAGTTGGARGAVYYNGEFYDNVLFRIHGQSSTGFPKKSYNIDFNHTQLFRWSTNAPQVKKINLLSNWADKSKVRNVLAYEVMRQAGVAAHFAFTVRVQQNGAFFSTADFVEDADEIYLERAGLNPDGAIYKIDDNLLDKSIGNTAKTGVEKKTRQTEDNRDLQELIDGLARTGPALSKYLHDAVDIPGCVNLLAATAVIRNLDMHSKNWYIYRDTGQSGEWTMLPWDLDLSCGRIWDTRYTYFDSGLFTDDCVVNSTAIRLVSEMFADPALRAMILRRIRTLMDRFLQPTPASGTPEAELYYERRLNEQSALIDPPDIVPSDARQDFEKWGSWLQGGATVRYTNMNGAVETMAKAIQRWKTEYLPGRRKYIYNTQILGKGGEIPLAQTGGVAYTDVPLIAVGAQAQVLVPTNGTLGVTWTGNPNAEPFGTTGWINGPTPIGYDRGAGYQALIGTDVGGRMQSNNSVYIRLEFNVSNSAAIDRLELRMKYDDGFVAFLNGLVVASANAPTLLQWNSAAKATHKANLSVFEIFDISSKRSYVQPGRNILAIQGLNDSVASSGMVIVPELHGGVAGPGPAPQPFIQFGAIEANPGSGNQDEEFIELVNANAIAVDISDWRLAGAVEHAFHPGTVLPPNGALYVCPKAAAFRTRTVSPKGGEGLFVQGGYKGHLSSRGETLLLIDSTGATNNTIAFPAQVPNSTFPADPAGDTNGNGERDLIDYALGNDLGLSPIFPKLNLEPGTAGAPPSLQLTYPINPSVDTVQVAIFFSQDLRTWEDGASYVDLVSKGPLTDGRVLVTWRVKPPFQNQPHVFLRLRVAAP